MTSETPNTIKLEVSKDRIAADLVGLVKHLTGAALQGALLQNWPGAVASLFDAAEAIRIERNEGALAWQLLLTGIGETLSELANQQPPTSLNQKDVETIIKRIRKEATDIVIPVNFLENPLVLPPVALAKATLLEWLAPQFDAPLQQNRVNLARRFDSALILGLRRAIRQDEAHYRPLFAMREDPTRLSWQVLEDWRLYRSRLVAEFRVAPVFDESFAIDQIYVPLNAWHKMGQKHNGKAEQKVRRKVVHLTNDILAWLRGERENNRLRLISGGPGSGKSSVMKALAAELAENGNKGQPVDVLLFPLQRFHWRSDIIESVATTLNTYEDQMLHNPLHQDHLRERQTPLLLIFDGLDELATTSEVSEAISATFLRELSTTLRSFEKRPVWSIITGRDAIFGNIEGPTSTLPGEQFHLLPYHVRERGPRRLNQRYYYDPNRLLKADKRLFAFKRFIKAKGKPSEDIPKAYSNLDLHDVSSQPLLNYFLLTSGPEEIADGNLARIYNRLFKRLHARNRNIDGRSQDAGKPGAALSQDIFDRVFEAMAVAAWRTGGTRAASWEEMLSEVEREDSYLSRDDKKLRDVFNSHMKERGAQKPFRLAAAFFMRNQQATGVEFTHKSFADYLYARRLAKELATMANGLLVMPEVKQGMLSRWESLTAQHRISPEVRRFLELEIEATVDSNKMKKWHNILAPVMEWVFRNGWQIPVETSMRRAEQCSSQMEEALFIAWHALWRPDNVSRYWTLGKNTGDLLYRAMARQGAAHGQRYSYVFISSWSGADLSNSDFHNVYLQGVNLNRANLENADLTGANLEQADLVGANLSRAYLEDTVLTSGNLKDADLSYAVLDDAFLIDANLSGADLSNAELENANLSGANLINADLSGANLCGANLSSTTLEGAKLERTKGLPT